MTRPAWDTPARARPAWDTPASRSRPPSNSQSNAFQGARAGGRVDTSATAARRDFGTTDTRHGLQRGLTQQIVSNLGAGDEANGAMAYGATAVGNTVNALVGRPNAYSASQAYHAAAERDRQEQARFAQEHPVQNALATGLGIMTAGAPNAGVAGAQAVGGASTAALQNGGRFAMPALSGNTVQQLGEVAWRGAQAALPYAFVNQQGDVGDRIPGTLENAAVAGGASAALSGGARLLGAVGAARAANPPQPTDNQILLRRGVDLTPGQAMGGVARTVEDSAARLPGMGDAIKWGQRSGIRSYNRAEINDGLANIGTALPRNVRPGRNAVEWARQAVSGAYTRSLSRVTVAPDAQMVADIDAGINAINHPATQAEARAIVDNIVGTQFNGQISGEQWKRVDEQLGAAAAAADRASATQPLQRQTAGAIRQAQTAIRGVLQRTDPQAAAEVSQADRAWASLNTVRRASRGTATEARGGVFTPAEQNRAMAANNRGSYELGRARGQELTGAAVRVLPPTVPDSGTPGALAMQALAGAGAGAAGNAMGAHGVTPALGLYAAGSVGAAAIYNPATQAALNVIYRAVDRAGQAVPPGQVEAALAALQREAARNPALVPVFEQARTQVAQRGQPQQGQQPQATPR